MFLICFRLKPEIDWCWPPSPTCQALDSQHGFMAISGTSIGGNYHLLYIASVRAQFQGISPQFIYFIWPKIWYIFRTNPFFSDPGTFPLEVGPSSLFLKFGSRSCSKMLASRPLHGWGSTAEDQGDLQVANISGNG